jgi:hypothetical protein
MYAKYEVNLVVQLGLDIKESVQLGLSQHNAPWVLLGHTCGEIMSVVQLSGPAYYASRIFFYQILFKAHNFTNLMSLIGLSLVYRILSS